VVAVVCGGLLGSLVGCSSLQGTGDKGYITGEGRVVEVGLAEREDAIELTGDDLQGDPVDVADFRGKPVVVTVWGSWCAPCRAEADEVAAVARQYDGKAQFVGINIRDANQAQGEAFERAHDLSFPSIFSPGGDTLLSFPGTLTASTIPAFVVLDAEGRVAASIIGPLPSQGTLETLVEDAVSESRSKADG